MKLALDAMGGDHAPAATVEGAVLFAKEHPAHHVVLVGDELRVRAQLAGLSKQANLSVRHASEVVGMDEHATAIRKKRDSSLRVCFDLMKEGQAGAMVSAGNSGAVMAGALLVLGRILGVERPAIAAVLPTLKGEGRCLLLDAGANIDCRPSQLAQFAVMGEAYASALFGVERPRIGVLANGEEESKGTDLTRAALALLRKSDIALSGNVEGRDIFSGDVEVVVTDGFTGNVVLKTSEGAAMGVAGMIRNAIEKAGLSERIGALLLKPTLAGLKRMVDYAEVGGAPLLGVNGVGIVAHGRSSPKAVKNALRAALQIAESGLTERIARRIQDSARWLPEQATKKGKGATSEGPGD